MSENAACARFYGEPCDPENCCGGRNSKGEPTLRAKREASAANPQEKPKGWPDKCGVCGAHWSMIGFDYADGFNCRNCGGCDADE